MICRLEFWLLPYATFFVLPLFALANAGVEIGSPERLASPIGLGIIVGLLVGKPLGITLMSWLAVRLGVSGLPRGVRWPHLFGVSVLAGMGFTMSLFISNLAFPPGEELSTAKVAILSASLLAGVIGYVVLRITLPKSREAETVQRVSETLLTTSDECEESDPAAS